MRSWSGVKEAEEVFSYLSPLTSNLPLTTKKLHHEIKNSNLV